jgi:hypothetical protein
VASAARTTGVVYERRRPEKSTLYEIVRPSCLGRRMCATAANLIEDVLPEVAHRPWVLTFPFPWRRRLAQDGALFGVLTRIFVESVERFYEERAAR